MVGLKRSSNGSWSARKRIPDDVRDEYAALYGPRLEAKFYAPVGTAAPTAKQQFSEWLAEIEGHIRAIRAKRNGEGVALTERQARAMMFSAELAILQRGNQDHASRHSNFVACAEWVGYRERK